MTDEREWTIEACTEHEQLIDGPEVPYLGLVKVVPKTALEAERAARGAAEAKAEFDRKRADETERAVESNVEDIERLLARCDAAEAERNTYRTEQETVTRELAHAQDQRDRLAALLRRVIDQAPCIKIELDADIRQALSVLDTESNTSADRRDGLM